MGSYYIVIKKRDGSTIEWWCPEEFVNDIVSRYMSKKDGNKVKIYRRAGRKWILEKGVE